MTKDQEAQQLAARSLGEDSHLLLQASAARQAQVVSAWQQEVAARIYAVTSAYQSAIDRQARAVEHIAKVMAEDRSVFTNEDHVQAFMERGWVMPLHSSADDVLSLVELFDNDPDLADDELCFAYEESTEYIRSGLIDRFPSRAHIIKDAFEAHEAGKYNLSVPVFLVQADGMWHERGGKHIFSGKREKAIKRRADEFRQGSLTRKFILALKNRSYPLLQSMKSHPGSPLPLNRHLVLHGDSLDYGTRKNSYQALAFLDYCGMVLPDLPDE